MAVEIDPEGQARRLRLWRIAGFFLGIVVAILAVPLCFVALWIGDSAFSMLTGTYGGSWIVLFIFIGLVQLVWLAPMTLISALFPLSRGFALGLIVGGVIVFLLNATCAGLVFAMIAQLG